MAEPFEYRDGWLPASPETKAPPKSAQRGRGTGLNPGNRYESTRLHVLGDYLDEQASDPDTQPPRIPTEVIPDDSKTLLNRIDSPDVGFEWSINPYRGCEHGCVYCYARPFHEMLGYSCGIDFETKILAKHDAPALLRRALSSPKWQGDAIMMSGVTDCYQPIEKDIQLARQCLEVLAECRQPVAIVTKNKLVVRDLDLLQQLAKHNATTVALSITTLDTKLAAKLEPRASSPADRLTAIRELSSAGIPVGVMSSPMIPGLNDRELPSILQAAAEAGATWAGYVLIRLPHQVKDLFLEWLAHHYPDRAGRIESLIKQMRGGSLYDSSYGQRMRGQGPIANHITHMFNVFTKKYSLDTPIKLSSTHFRKPQLDGQIPLFG